ncbi:MAG TPA: hypothetical protein PLK41_04650, partial [Defluviitoga tunisiensis]|nr:hypothetical protein [Defluviitoga tunisiensis]
MNLRYERNPDGSFKAIFVVTPEGEIPLEFEVNPDGTYKVIYSTAIGNVYLDQFIQSLANENAKIRYNSETNTWQYTTDGVTWNDFGSGSGGGQETDPIYTADKPKLFDKTIDTLDDITEGAENKHLTNTLKSQYDEAYIHSQSEHPFGLVGNKEVDESNLGDDKILVYKSALDKLTYETKPSGSGTDEKVKATSTDPQAGYLNEKIDDNHFEIVDNKLKIKTGKVGTKEVDETDIGNDKILVYNTTTDKLEYQTKPSGGSSGGNWPGSYPIVSA